MRRRFVAGVLVFTLVAGPAIALIWTQTVLMYGAKAEVQVSPVIPGLIGKDRTIPFYDSFMNTQASIVRSQPVLQRVLDRKDVKATQWHEKPPETLIQRLLGNQVPELQRLRESLRVRPRARTEIIDISFTARSNKDAQLIVDAVLEEYIKVTEQRRNEAQDDIDRTLTIEYKSLQIEIETQEKICAGFRKKLRTGNPGELIGKQRVRLEEMEGRLSELDITVKLLENQIKDWQENGSNPAGLDAPGRTEQERAYYADEEWRRLDYDALTLQHEIDSRPYGEQHPNMVKLKKDLEYAKELRATREAQLDEEWRSHSRRTTVMVSSREGGGDSPHATDLAALESQLKQAKYEKTLRERMWEQLKKDFDKLVEDAQRLEEQNTELRHLYANTNEMRQSIERRNMERKIPPRIAVLTRAFSRSEPDKDRRVPYTAIAFAVALVLGCGMGLLARKGT